MKILLLLLLYSVQMFGEEPLTARETSTFASVILDTFSAKSQEVMKEPIVHVLSVINPDNAAKVVELVIDKLRNHEGPITPSYVEGMMVGIDAGVSASGAHAQVESQSSTVANISVQPPSDDQHLIVDDSSVADVADFSPILDTAIEPEQDPEQTAAVDADVPDTNQ